MCLKILIQQFFTCICFRASSLLESLFFKIFFMSLGKRRTTTYVMQKLKNKTCNNRYDLPLCLHSFL